MSRKLQIIIGAVVFLICLCSVVSLVLWFLVFIPNNSFTGSGNLKTETRNVTQTFNSITLNGNFSVTLEQSTDQSVQISADDNVLPQITSDVNGNDLTIQYKRSFPYIIDPIVKMNNPATVLIKYNKLNNLTINGSGDLKENDRIRTDNLNITLNGSGSIKLDLFADELNSTLNGAGSITFTGAVKTEKINVTGSGVYDAKDLESKSTQINLNGSANAKIRADDSLNISLNGSGNVSYSGDPKQFNQNINGSGTVTKN